MWVLNQLAIWKRGAASVTWRQTKPEMVLGGCGSPPSLPAAGCWPEEGQGGPRKPVHSQEPGPAHLPETLQGRGPGCFAGPGTSPPWTAGRVANKGSSVREDEGNQWSPESNNRTTEPLPRPASLTPASQSHAPTTWPFRT